MGWSGGAPLPGRSSRRATAARAAATAMPEVTQATAQGTTVPGSRRAPGSNARHTWAATGSAMLASRYPEGRARVRASSTLAADAERPGRPRPRQVATSANRASTAARQSSGIAQVRAATSAATRRSMRVAAAAGSGSAASRMTVPSSPSEGPTPRVGRTSSRAASPRRRVEPEVTRPLAPGWRRTSSGAVLARPGAARSPTTMTGPAPSAHCRRPVRSARAAASGTASTSSCPGRSAIGRSPGPSGPGAGAGPLGPSANSPAASSPG